MNLNIKTKIKILLKSFFFLSLFAVTVNVGAVWMPPSSSAPGNNTKPPVNEGTFTQFKNGSFTALGLKATTAAILEGTLQIPGGVSPLEGKVLTSDANGFASWQVLTGGPGGGDVTAPPTVGGTLNYVTKWTDTHAIGDSQIYDNGARIGIATATPDTNSKLDVVGKIKMTGFQMNVGTQPLTGKVLTTDEFGNGTWQALGGCGTAGGWTKSGTVVRLTNSTDKVGIGLIDCPTPASQQLEITKNFKIPNTTVNGTAGVIYTTYLTQPKRLLHNFGGSSGIFLGEDAGSLDSSAQSSSNNIGVGAESLSGAQATSDNIAIGNGAISGNSISGSKNISIGNDSSYGANTLNENTAMGSQTLIIDYVNNNCCGGSSVTGTGNVAIGNGTLWSVVNQPGTYARSHNTAVGDNAFHADNGIKIGSNNSALGASTHTLINTVEGVTVIGTSARVGNNNLMILGQERTYSEYNQESDYIKKWGFGVQPGVANAIKVGDDATNGNGATLTKEGVWTPGSDRTKKHNIQNINYGLDEVMKLRPVSFDWNGSNTHDIGFIAQEVKEIIPEVVSGEEGSMTMSYSQINSVLAKALQELKEENDILKYETSLLEKELE